MSDLVTLVDEHDHVIGSLDKVEAHRGVGKLHRAISVFLFRKHEGNVELLMQQRSPQKIVGAGQWANTVCGNVWPGESYEECAIRRLRHEVGIEVEAGDLTSLTTFRYQVQCNDQFGENEIDHVFVGWYEGEVVPNSDEVSDVRWVAWAEITGADRTLSLDFAPWFKLLLQDEVIGSSLDTISKMFA